MDCIRQQRPRRYSSSSSKPSGPSDGARSPSSSNSTATNSIAHNPAMRRAGRAGLKTIKAPSGAIKEGSKVPVVPSTDHLHPAGSLFYIPPFFPNLPWFDISFGSLLSAEQILTVFPPSIQMLLYPRSLPNTDQCLSLMSFLSPTLKPRSTRSSPDENCTQFTTAGSPTPRRASARTLRRLNRPQSPAASTQ